MRATGIVRRIDDLGRVVVPKEIRRTLRIREGDPLEIFTDREGEIILKKYSPIGELGQFAGEYAESLSQATGHLVCITDRDHVIAASGQGKREFENKPISKQLEMMIEDRKNVVASKGEKEFVKSLTEKFCEMVLKSGCAENFDALTGDGLRDRAYTWTASVMLVMAHEFLAEETEGNELI